MRQQGHDVSEARSAEDALALLQTREVDLVVTDYQLGGATGSWLAHIASRGQNTRSPRAVLITGHEHVADAEGLTVLRKPLDIPSFLASISQALDLADIEQAPAPGPAQRIALALYVNDA